jgi:hypothetical protein
MKKPRPGFRFVARRDKILRMRILVLTEDGDGEARVRERRESFDITEFRLSYTCPNPNCKNEFTFKIEKSEPISDKKPTTPKPSWARCPACNMELRTEGT